MAARKNAGHRKAKATTADVVGRRLSPKGKWVPVKWRKHFDHLNELREQLLKRQMDLARDALQEQPITFSTHMADAGTDTYDRDLALGMLSSEQDALYQIEQAMDRIRNGSYGICELTGKPIETGRLEAIPWTRFSTRAERELELRGARKRAGLGPRDTVVKSAARDEEEESEQEG
jgi:RNA polymerase-binding transcription factor DksA